ncbi:hypothetical protein H5410_022606 [Solanum commersonii]|uniref:Uncharacterized protein n=1 Tax=Solanum commersonii TaxID=4109 RepID=A0A9J5ZFX7_SOLCO|nr:hypothetical protein H5410_022606 [Solanum commersonii]
MDNGLHHSMESRKIGYDTSFLTFNGFISDSHETESKEREFPCEITYKVLSEKIIDQEENFISNQIAKAKPPTYPKLKIKFLSKGLVGIHLVEPQYKLYFELGDNLELLFSMIVA